MRSDLALIANLINREARVLDLGCGEGELLATLQKEKAVKGYGLDRDANNILTCITKGVNVIDQDLDNGLANFPDDSFDMVIMTETLQSVRDPKNLMKEMLRIGQECIVTFPNFGHWRCRAQLALTGRMPVSQHLPYFWHDTPNIRLCTFNDFESFCAEERFHIIERRVVNVSHQESSILNLIPNFFGVYAFYRLGRPQ